MNYNVTALTAIDLDNLFLAQKSFSFKDFRIEKGITNAAHDAHVFVQNHRVTLKRTEKKLLALLIIQSGSRLTPTAIKKAMPNSAISPKNLKPAHVHLCNVRIRIKDQLQDTLPPQELDRITRAISLEGLHKKKPTTVEQAKQKEQDEADKKQRSALRKKRLQQADKELSALFNKGVLDYGPYRMEKSIRGSFSEASLLVYGHKIEPTNATAKPVIALLIAAQGQHVSRESFSEKLPPRHRKETLLKTSQLSNYITFLKNDIREQLKNVVSAEKIQEACDSIVSIHQDRSLNGPMTKKSGNTGSFRLKNPT